MDLVRERLEEHTVVNSAQLEEAIECTSRIAEGSNTWRERALASELVLAQLQELVKVAHGRLVGHNERVTICPRCFARERLREIALELEAPKS